MLAYSLRYGRRLAIPPLGGNDLPKRPPCVGINQLVKSSHDPPHSRGCPHRVGIPASWPMGRLQKIIDEWRRGQEGCRRKHIRYQQWALYKSAGSIQFWPSESVAPSGRAPGKGIRALYSQRAQSNFDRVSLRLRLEERREKVYGHCSSQRGQSKFDQVSLWLRLDERRVKPIVLNVLTCFDCLQERMRPLSR